MIWYYPTLNNHRLINVNGGQTMKHQHAKQVKQSASLAQQIAKGTLASAVLETGGKFMSTIIKNPAVVFGLGIATGYLVFKYRKEIIAHSTKAVDAGKDFILQQKENLEDMVAEAKED